MWKNILQHQARLTYQAKFFMLNYLHRYGASSKYQIPIVQLTKELRIDKDTVRQNLTELSNAKLIKVTSLNSTKRGRPKLVCSLSEQFEKDLQLPCKIPEYAAMQLEVLGLHNHHNRTGAFRNELQLSKSQSLLLGILIAHCEMPGIVYNLSQKKLSEHTGEKVSTIKQYLKKLKVAGYLTELWPGLIDKDLVGRQAAGYMINFHLLAPWLEAKDWPLPSCTLGNFASKKTLAVLEPTEKNVGTLTYDFDVNVKNFYEAKKHQYLEQVRVFSESISQPSPQTHLFIYWQATNLISSILREHWHEVNRKERISIQIVDKLASKYLEHILLIFKGTKVHNYRPTQTTKTTKTTQPLPEASENTTRLYNSLLGKFKQNSCVVSAYCFLLFFDSLRLSTELARYQECAIPNIDHKTILFHAEIFTKHVFKVTGIINQSAFPSELPK